MAQNITLLGASYSDVPAVTLPKTGGGTAQFDDTTDANATASDIASGKTAYVNGVKLTGTSSGGGGGGGITADDVAMRTISEAIGSTATMIGSYAFASCSKLTTASFPNVTQNIEASAFYRCSSLATVNIPNAAYIGAYAFASCSHLTSVSFPNVSYIGAQAFANASRMTTARFSSVKTIGNSAFSGCSQLTSAYFLSTSMATLGNVAVFAYTPMSNSTYTGSFGSIYVPASLVSSYKNATNWKSYSARITSYVE